MDITYLGHSSFKLKGKSATLITDPYNPEKVGLKFPKNQADIVTISHQHDDHNYMELVEGVRKVVSGPGEYEIGGVSIIGVQSFHDNEKGQIRGKNTVYVIEMDEVRLVHLGDLGHQLEKDAMSALGIIDILFIPVGGYYTIGPKEAVELINTLSPKIIIPMHYQAQGLNAQTFSDLTGVEEFIKEANLKVENTPKLVVKPELFTSEDQVVVVLEKK